MWRTLITGAALAALLHNPVSAQIVCGDQPKIAATSSAEEFKADASGKAQLLAKILPSAEINGKVEQWKTEQHQQYKDLDQHELTFYWVWVSCQMIASSREMTGPQKTEQWDRVRAAFSQPSPSVSPPRIESEFVSDKLISATAQPSRAGTNADTETCVPAPPNMAFVKGSGTLEIIKDERDGVPQAGNPRRISHSGPEQICVHLTAQPTGSNQLAEIVVKLHAKTVPKQ
jgi:hypothetical protein